MCTERFIIRVNKFTVLTLSVLLKRNSLCWAWSAAGFPTICEHGTCRYIAFPRPIIVREDLRDTIVLLVFLDRRSRNKNALIVLSSTKPSGFTGSALQGLQEIPILQTTHIGNVGGIASCGISTAGTKSTLILIQHFILTRSLCKLLSASSSSLPASFLTAAEVAEVELIRANS